MMNILNKNNDHAVTIAPISIIFTVFLLLSLYGLYYIRFVLVLLLLSFILMVALNPVVKLLNRKLYLPKALSIFFAYVLLVAFLGLLLALLIPPLAKQVVALVNNINVPFVQEKIKDFNFTLQELNTVVSSVGSSFGVIYSVVNMTFNGVLTIFTILVMSFYLMIERPQLHNKLAWFTNNPQHLVTFKEYINSIETQLGGWVRAQLILMFSIFALTFTSLTLISVPYALPLALLAGLLEIVPNLGPTISMLPALFVAYVSFGPVMMGIVFLIYIIIQQLENNVLVPRVMQANANVNSLVAITVIIIGLSIGGVIGALLAIPLYIIIRTTYSIYLQPKL